MVRPRYLLLFLALSTLVAQDSRSRRAQEQAEAAEATDHADCAFFGPQRDRFLAPTRKTRALSTTTDAVMRDVANAIPSPRRAAASAIHDPGTIDAFIWADFDKRGIKPAPPTTDWEFIRRVTLDLTGRIPTPERVTSFVQDTAGNKRAKLVDELLADPAWVDKWTMFFGDLYQNVDSKPSTGLRRFPEGRNALYKWIHDSLASNKRYSLMAYELISASTLNTYEDGPSNWILNGQIGGGPTQDIMDQATSFVFDTFLGMTYVNCVLCHNGRGHLDQLSLWGSRTTRYQAWQLASYMSHLTLPFPRTRVDPNNANITYAAVSDNPRATDYAMNTTTGNRPGRIAPTGCRSGQPCYYVPPQYIFNGDTPKPGENYRNALARSVTSDFQFARATVNYIWAHLFGRGIVDPPNTFDPARLDPNNPPPAPWTLQPSNPALLNALAQHFIDSGYDLRALMKEIAASDVYQLSSRYEGTWNPEWEPYFARHFVRRLWGEEIHDAVLQSSGTATPINVTGFTTLGFPQPMYAMQLPDVTGPGGDSQTVLDNFLRGNRDDNQRRSDGSILQALTLMNNNFIVQRTRATGTNSSKLVASVLTKSNNEIIDALYLAILSRQPSPAERQKINLPSGSTRTAAIQDLAWTLYNKVDFIFNY